ncbi:VOC family protein [soil metagenome]
MTTPTLQIAIDAGDPHLLNRFLSEVMGYEIEDHHDGVIEIVGAGYASFDDDTIEIDRRRAWKSAAACRPRDGVGPRLLFQHVSETKSVKNRVHLDVNVADDRRHAEVERLVGLGATPP